MIHINFHFAVWIKKVNLTLYFKILSTKFKIKINFVVWLKIIILTLYYILKYSQSNLKWIKITHKLTSYVYYVD